MLGRGGAYGATVPTLRPTLASPVVRTHFDDDHAWTALQEAICTPSPEGFLGSVDVVEDRSSQVSTRPPSSRPCPRPPITRSCS